MGVGAWQQQAGAVGRAGKCVVLQWLIGPIRPRGPIFLTYTLPGRRCATAIPFLSTQLDHTTTAGR
jgi:hypothetical protein